MTPQDHAKTLGVIYLAAGTFLSIPPLGFLAWALLAPDASFERSLNFSKWSWLGLLVTTSALLLSLFTLSVLVVGGGFLKRKHWVRLPALAFCVPAVFFFPFGTGLAVYTWWFLHSEGGRRLFSKPAR
ncbi:MAG: hypothetical protein DMF64_10725 [Acidobacteria bacterium]|nr:MAG: hypothetical protein DMF64_10725 [Acidobacteriota bacterium]